MTNSTRIFLIDELKDKLVNNRLENEQIYALLNGLALSYMKITKNYSRYFENQINEASSDLILSLDRYERYTKKGGLTKERQQNLDSLLPKKFRDNIESLDNVGEEDLYLIAEIVIDEAVKNNVRESKSVLVDKNVLLDKIDAYDEALVTLDEEKLAMIESVMGPDAVKKAINHCENLAFDVVEVELAYYNIIADYIVRYCAGIEACRCAEIA